MLGLVERGEPRRIFSTRGTALSSAQLSTAPPAQAGHNSPLSDATRTGQAGGDWASPPLALLTGLLPHIRQFVRVRQALVSAGALGSAVTDLLETPRIGVLHLDRRGQILVATTLGLTRAESQIAVGVAAGQTVHTLAVTTGRQVSSIHWHLKRIYRKLGLSRQAERHLVRAITDFA